MLQNSDTKQILVGHLNPSPAWRIKVDFTGIADEIKQHKSRNLRQNLIPSLNEMSSRLQILSLRYNLPNLDTF